MQTVQHDHLPLYRIARAGWADPLDIEPGRRTGGRWNAANTHGVLYTCCSVAVARAIVIDISDSGHSKWMTCARSTVPCS